MASQPGKQGSFGEKRNEGLAPVVSEPSPGHSQVPPTGPMSKQGGSANAAAVLQRVCPWGFPGASGPTTQVLLWPQEHSPTLRAKTKPASVSLQGTARQTPWFCLHSFPPPATSPRGLSSRGSMAGFRCPALGYIQGPQPHSTCPWVPPSPALGPHSLANPVPRGVGKQGGADEE